MPASRENEYQFYVQNKINEFRYFTRRLSGLMPISVNRTLLVTPRGRLISQRALLASSPWGTLLSFQTIVHTPLTPDFIYIPSLSSPEQVSKYDSYIDFDRETKCELFTNLETVYMYLNERFHMQIELSMRFAIAENWFKSPQESPWPYQRGNSTCLGEIFFIKSKYQ